MRILYYDLETAPNLVYSFNTFKANIGHEQIVEPARIICFSYQWDDETKVHFESEHHSSRKEMLDKLWELLDEADFVVGYNNAGFDDIWVKSELLSEGYPPFSPFRSIDLYQGIKRLTRFPSKKLAYVAPRMLDDAKVTHTGFKLWIDCLNGDEKAWKLMKKYACLTPDHKVLTTDLRWVEIGSLDIGDKIIGFDEEPNQGGTLGRRVRPSEILGNRRVMDRVYAVHLSNGDVIKANGQHQWLTRNADHRPSGLRMMGGSQWRTTEQLVQADGTYLSGKKAPGLRANPTVLNKYISPSEPDVSYDAGWLAGMLDGEGSLTMRPGSTGQGDQPYVGGFMMSLTQAEGDTLDRLEGTLDVLHGDCSLSLKPQPDTAKTKSEDRRKVGRFTFKGGFWKNLDFLSRVRPERLISNLDFESGPRLERGEIVTVDYIEDLGEQEIVILETSTKTYIAEGYPMHNCQDTKLLKPLYNKIRAWLPNHPNFALELNGEQLACPVCQSTNVQRRGTTTTNASVFQRFVCNDCGRWSRVSHRVKTTGLRNV